MLVAQLLRHGARQERLLAALGTAAARQLARREGVEMPIVETVNRVLFDGQPARSAIGALMTRELRAEVDG